MLLQEGDGAMCTPDHERREVWTPCRETQCHGLGQTQSNSCLRTACAWTEFKML